MMKIPQPFLLQGVFSPRFCSSAVCAFRVFRARAMEQAQWWEGVIDPFLVGEHGRALGQGRPAWETWQNRYRVQAMDPRSFIQGVRAPFYRLKGVQPGMALYYANGGAYQPGPPVGEGLRWAAFAILALRHWPVHPKSTIEGRNVEAFLDHLASSVELQLKQIHKHLGPQVLPVRRSRDWEDDAFGALSTT